MGYSWGDFSTNCREELGWCPDIRMIYWESANTSMAGVGFWSPCPEISLKDVWMQKVCLSAFVWVFCLHELLMEFNDWMNIAEMYSGKA